MSGIRVSVNVRHPQNNKVPFKPGISPTKICREGILFNMPKKYVDVRITVHKKLQVDDVHRSYAADGVHPRCQKFQGGYVFL